MKNKLNYLKVPFLFLLASLSFTSSFSEPPNLALVKSEIRQWHDAGLYNRELEQQIEQAHNYVLEQVKINETKPIKEILAIVLDIDETSLSNYKFMDQSDFTANRQLIEKHMQAADSPAIESMLKLYKDATRLGVKMFFVTGRNASFKEATELNLSKAGFSNWEALYLKPIDYPTGSIISFKSEARADIEQKGFKIIVNIGDQYSDLLGGHAQKTFKLPNPFYFLP